MITKGLTFDTGHAIEVMKSRHRSTIIVSNGQYITSNNNNAQWILYSLHSENYTVTFLWIQTSDLSPLAYDANATTNKPWKHHT